MGFIRDAIGLGGSHKASGSAANAAIEGDREAAKKARAKLLATQGGVSGEEVLSGQTSKRTTLLGN